MGEDYRAVYYRDRKEKGICRVCSSLVVPGRSRCQQHLDLERYKAIEKNKRSIKAGKCLDCKAPAKNGQVRCVGCLERKRQYHLDYRARARNNGKCRNCNNQAEPRKLLCKICSEKKRLRIADKRIKGMCPSHPKTLPIPGTKKCQRCAWLYYAALIKKRYHMSLEDYARMEHQQDRKCACCKRTSLELVVDHDHKTGTIRALLCRNCNWMLGHAHESRQILEDAIAYLKRHSNNQDLTSI